MTLQSARVSSEATIAILHSSSARVLASCSLALFHCALNAKPCVATLAGSPTASAPWELVEFVERIKAIKESATLHAPREISFNLPSPFGYE